VPEQRRQHCATGGRWEDGWIVFADHNDDGDRDDDETIIAVEPPSRPGITIRGNKPVSQYVSYTSYGHTRMANGALQMGTLTVCRPGSKAVDVVLANGGRVRVDRTKTKCGRRKRIARDGGTRAMRRFSGKKHAVSATALGGRAVHSLCCATGQPRRRLALRSIYHAHRYKMEFTMNRSVPRTRGFTLLEVMITVCIVAILAAIALPAYQDSVRRGKIIDATVRLGDFRAQQEKWFLDNRTYQKVPAAGTACGIDDPPLGATDPFKVECTAPTATTYNIKAPARPPAACPRWSTTSTRRTHAPPQARADGPAAPLAGRCARTARANERRLLARRDAHRAADLCRARLHPHHACSPCLQHVDGRRRGVERRVIDRGRPAPGRRRGHQAEHRRRIRGCSRRRLDGAPCRHPPALPGTGAVFAEARFAEGAKRVAVTPDNGTTTVTFNALAVSPNPTPTRPTRSLSSMWTSLALPSVRSGFSSA
jgi:prepilin-type N-terminal cleavage/methylation domain-containing protein